MIDRADLPKLLEHWRSLAPHSDQVAAAQIIDELLLEIRKLEQQRDDFRRQLADQVNDGLDDVPHELEDDDVCPYCDGDGMDPLNDYCLECPHCGGAG